MGGDPGVDYPVVTLERLEGRSWVPVLTESGRPLSMGPDILVTHTPNPLNPADVTQVHMWYASWQAVGHVADRAGVPLGLYHLHVEGQSYAGGSATWPWATDDYVVDSPTFEVGPAEISLQAEGTDLVAWLQAPARGYRMIALGGHVRGQNPLPEGDVTCDLVHADESVTRYAPTASTQGATTRLAGVLESGDVVQVVCEDVYGNLGRWSAPPAR